MIARKCLADTAQNITRQIW